MATQLQHTNQVQFLHGTESSLQNLRDNASSIKPGAFYVTSDTNRMYLGVQENSVNKIVPLNQGVITVAAVANLPTTNIEAGYFYYATTENVLCVYNGQKWVQINPDTNTTNSTYTASIAPLTGESNTFTITDTITDSAGKDVAGSWNVQGGDKITLSLSADKSTLIIKCTAKYTLDSTTNTDKGVITLTDESGANEAVQSVYIVGDDYVKVSSTDGGTISINSTSLHNADIAQADMAVDANGVIKTTLQTYGGATLDGGASITPTIILGDNTNTKYAFSSGTATLPVYTKSEVDDIFKDLDAVRYKGTIANTAALNALTNLSIGDAYKLTGGGVEYKDREGAKKNDTKTGDLLIAYSLDGKEGDGGYIPSNKICWDLIPSGDDTQDTTYHGVAVQGTEKTGAHGLLLKNNGGQQVAQLTAQCGNDWIEITSTPSKSVNGLDYDDQNALTIQHKTFASAAITPDTDTEVTQGTRGTAKITYVTGITRDQAGHITGYNTQTATLTDTDTDGNISINLVDAATATLSGAKSAAKFTHTTIYTDINGLTSGGAVDMTIASQNDNLVVGVSGTSAITLGLVWGTF